MGRLIGSGNPENFGENLFVSKAQEYLDDTHIIYWNRQIFGREFDYVCGCTFRIDNPKNEDLLFMKKMVEIRMKEIVCSLK